ncbi:MAG: hypothetical protein JEZ10_08355 [Verrucomicrobia bacterium]|nr:hypothetical protein [Verrucomicrobiota bacterium]
MTDISTSLTIGTVCHENGHMLCKYPDFYDYDGDSSGCGKYTLMASGNHYYQTSPISVGAYLRYHSGWVDTVDLTSTTHERCSVRVDEGRIYMYDNPSVAWPGEYFLLENRAKIGWEAGSGLPDQGLLIMHCDEDGNRDAQNMTEALHYECSVEQADYNFDLENDTNGGDAYDLFHSGETGPNTIFNDASSPNAHWWKKADADPSSGDDSGMDIHTISSSGETMTFVAGAGAPTGTREIALDQSSIYMETDYGQDAPANGFAVWNKQGGTLSYSITTNVSWLSVSLDAGTATTESDVIDLLFDSDGLSAGTYNGIITVTDSGAANSPQTISVQLVVFDQPGIGVNSNAFTSTAASGSAGTAQALKLVNTGGGTMDYSLTKSSSWLALSSTKGTVVQEEDLIFMDFDASLLAPGVYYDTVTVVSAAADNSPYIIDVEFDVTAPPEIGINPDSIVLAASGGTIDQALLTITNSGLDNLTFDITDNHVSDVYTWLDSDDPGGPAYGWIDISGLGTAVPLDDDGESSMFSIGFDFPFYGADYSQFQIGANGGISFSSGNLDYNNYTLPSSSAPSRSLLAFWDDLNPASAGSVRYHSTAERLVVSWLAVPRYGTTTPETFQIVLYPDGRIVYQYNTLNGILTSCTVGLQNGTSGSDYIQLAYNSSYLKSSFAVEVAPPDSPWLSWMPDQGTVSAGSFTSVWFTGSASNLSDGVYTTLVTIACNDPDTPEVQIPVEFTVSDGDLDDDELPDWWEALYYGGVTNANAVATAANGVNTVLEAYIAGLDPTDPDAVFLISDLGPLLSENILQWQDVSGRVYTIYWSSNLLSGFEVAPLASNITSGAFTDTVHNADDAAFYRLEVQLAP